MERHREELIMASLGVRVTFKEDIQKVWDVITSVDKYKSWRSDLKEMEIIDEEQYVETTEDGYVTTYIVVRRAEGKRLELEVENETLSGRWVINLTESSEGTEFALQARMSANKFYYQPYVRGYLKNQQLNYMTDLKKILTVI